MVRANVSDSKRGAKRVRQLWLVPTAGQGGRHLVADVAIDAPAAGLRAYAVPDELRAAVRPGAWVRVPYGRGARVVPGLCVRVGEQAWDHTRAPVLEARAGPAWLSEDLLQLGLWVSEYYACAPWKTFAALLPVALRQPRLRTVRYVRATGAAPARELTSRQAAALAALGAGEMQWAVARRQAGISPALLRTLCQRGVVECVTRQESAPRASVTWAEVQPAIEDAFELTPAQHAAVTQIEAAQHRPDPFEVMLLFGVPGSGKTEVYVRAVRAAVARGQQAILLIPEIALATQIVERLARRFARVAVLHSALTARVRHDTLAAIAAGEVDVVIGTRTAVFAPCPRLGLIVVDEEQETSFKNLAAPYYHARDVAIMRGRLTHVPVVLGSATPALETWHNVQARAHYRLVRLPDRVPGAHLPEVRRIEMPPGMAHGDADLLSPALQAELGETLAAGQQAILLHNRRGYAAFLRCSRCGLLVCCERCGSHMIYHQSERAMKCHRCGLRVAVPPRCLDDTCRGMLVRSGAAIQRLEEELRRVLPAARLLRLDSDTMRRRNDYAAALQRFSEGAADILLGTQMVAKGLDFPRVRLVGVIEADAALALPDFRASERVFQLIVQVVGRAGRREGTSLALVQTSVRPPAVIEHALRMDYEAFAQEELAQRRQLCHPPYVRLVRLVCADARPHRARQEAERLAETLRAAAGRLHAGLRVDAAEACLVRQRRGLLRWQVLVRAPRGVKLRPLLQETGRAGSGAPRVERFTIDVDPVDLL